ncbi:PAS domain S-box protein [Minwuia sp.]|uniref:PAS domain S-box protein n=1 Tax=Minwuia sp. TaxID=2493630 RepID=UPI003A92BFEF
MQPKPLDEAELAALGVATITGIPDAVVYCDARGHIRFWNRGAERIFGYSAAEALGQSLDIIIPERLRKRHWNGYFNMMKTGKSRHDADEMLSVPATTRSGATISVQFSVAPLKDENGAIEGIISILRDETETYNELRRLRKIESQHM